MLTFSLNRRFLFLVDYMNFFSVPPLGVESSTWGIYNVGAESA
jgi:hypothetical protein